MTSFLLIIPCFRERERLPAFLDELSHELAVCPLPISICTVDDGSGPEHAAWLHQHIESRRPQMPALLPAILSPTNLGKGGAIYLGWNRHRDTDWVAFADADGATSAREIFRVFKLIVGAATPSAAYFGSRIKMLGRNVHRKSSRHLTGRVFATVASVLLDLPVYDSQCGFKVIKRDVFDAIFPTLVEQRFCFDVDLLLRLRLGQHDVVEVPVDWIDKEGSKVSIVGDSIAMFKSLLKLRRMIRGAKH